MEATSTSSSSSSMSMSGAIMSCCNHPFLRRIAYRTAQCKTIGDTVPFIFHTIITSGKMSGIVFFSIYIVFLLVWLPFYLLTYLLSEMGVYLFAIGTIFFLGRAIIRLIAFPGASNKVTSEIEVEFARYSIRMLTTACNCVIDLANGVISCSNSGSSTNLEDGTTATNNRNLSSSSFAYYEIPSLWKRAKSYRDRAMSVYLNILTYVYENEQTITLSTAGIATTPSSPNNDNPQQQPTSHNNPQQQQHQRTKYGMNIFSGDIGNLAGITPQARSDGRELMKQLSKVLNQLDQLEQHGGKIFNSQILIGSRPQVFSDEARDVAKELIHSSSELRDFVSSLKPPASGSSSTTTTMNADGGGNGDNSSDDDSESDAGGAARNTNGQQQQQGNDSVYAAIQSGLSSILPMLDPPQHASIFGFDVQRGCMLSRYIGAKQIWVRRPKGGMIDVIHIPAIKNNDNMVHKKAVLYCNPNAGLIEVAAGMSLAGGNVGSVDTNNNSSADDSLDHSTWVDFYTDLGYDVYLFNYAGFGRSYGTTLCVQGNSKNNFSDDNSLGFLGRLKRIFSSSFLAFKPTPATLREDGLAVANYVITDGNIQKLVIHGESIGGVAASSTACKLSLLPQTRHKISLLICDRTFCNLEAVAQRLVGGWTGYAIKSLAPFWNTDVAADFLSAQCPKVVANDFADSIISDSSSLKSGISLFKEIRRGLSTTNGVGWVMETPLEYRMADFENICVNDSQYFAPGRTIRTQAPIWPSDHHVTLEEAFHFAACAKRIGRMAKQSLSSQTPQLFNLYDEEQGGNNETPMVNLASGGTTGSAVSINEAWQFLASCDGLCGATLGHAIKSGFDNSVAWLCACLIYGGQTIVARAETRLAKETNNTSPPPSGNSGIVILPSDFDGRPAGYEKQESETQVHPKPIPEILEKLKGLLGGAEESSPVAAVAYELKYVISMLEYIVARLTSAGVVESSWKCRHLKHDDTMVGSFMNLHCGHNNPFSKVERMRLKEILNEATGA